MRNTVPKARVVAGVFLAVLSLVAAADGRTEVRQRVDTGTSVRVDANGGPGRGKATAMGERSRGLGYPDADESINPAPRALRGYSRGEGKGAGGRHPGSGLGRPPGSLYRQHRQHGDPLPSRLPQAKQSEPDPKGSADAQQ